ncbi:MAG: GGDEF domain-containing protein [Planctomycetota bacterium]
MTFQNIEKLPSPPGVAVKLLQLFSDPDLSLDSLNEVISVDPILTARIIKYANSPMFARKYSAESLKQAITMLGLNGVKMIALSFSLADTKSEEADNAFDFDEFWGASLATAVCTKDLYHSSGRNADTGFLLGLMMNVGQLAVYCDNVKAYSDVLANKKVYDFEMLKVEQEQFSADRYEIGVEVMKFWNLPEAIVEAMESFCNEDQKGSFESRSLDVANKVSYTFLSENPDYEIVKEINSEIADLLEQEEEGAREFFDTALQNYSEYAEILSYEIPAAKSLESIELEAKTRMIELTLDIHSTNARVTAENNELKDMANIDPLTQLSNRRHYENVAKAEIDRSTRSKLSLGLLVLDIDFFKKVNDTYGHAAGDAILVGVAERLQGSIRTYDTVFRFGGEEFVVLLPSTEEQIVAKVAERLRESIEANPFEFEGTIIPVTTSVGGSTFNETNNVSIEELFAQADEALYAAKKGGRNRFIPHSLLADNKPLGVADMGGAATDSPSVTS